MIPGGPTIDSPDVSDDRLRNAQRDVYEMDAHNPGECRWLDTDDGGWRGKRARCVKEEFAVEGA